MKLLRRALWWPTPVITHLSEPVTAEQDALMDTVDSS